MNPIFNQKINISQKFGENPEIYRRFNLAGHNGFDFAAPEGTPIFSPIDGDVFFADYQATGYGKYIKIRNSENEVIFAHLSLIGRKIGDKIKKGDFLGLTGNTGFSTGPHLHFGIRELENGEIKNYGNGYFGYIDPQKYFQNNEDFFDENLKTEEQVDEKNLAKDYDNVPKWAIEAYDFVTEEGISNGERPEDFLSREEFFLMMFRFSEFIGEERELDEGFTVDFDSMDVSDRPSEWAADAYLFVVSEKFSNGERPKEFISREESWVLIQRFLKDYHQFQKVSRIDKFKDDTIRPKDLSDWAKRGYDWVVKNKISNGENPKKFVSRAEIWTMFLRVYEILENE